MWYCIKKARKCLLLPEWALPKQKLELCYLFISVHILPDKPMSRKPTEVVTENCEFNLNALKSCSSCANNQSGSLWICFSADFIKAFHMAREEPTKKYTAPQTESQEVGWISSPLVMKKSWQVIQNTSVLEDNPAHAFSSRSHQTATTEDFISTDSALTSLNTRNMLCGPHMCPKKNQANAQNSKCVHVYSSSKKK